MNIPEVKIRYHKELWPAMETLECHGNFVDLASVINVRLDEGESALIPLGISVGLPEGYWAQVVPRSSTFKKYGIIMANSFGVIDTDYCGDDDIWMMPVYATRDTLIPANTRIAQFRIVKDNEFNIVEVDKLEGPNRGGFGSTDNNA